MELDTLPVSLADFAFVYEQQIVLGHRDRVQQITAFGVTPWDVGDFVDFARIASGSLTSLCLFSSSDPYDEHRGALSFADLSLVLSAVRTYLPNLVRLALAVSGGRKSHQTCSELLVTTCLEPGGTID
jgi:hypothetical protein